MELYPYLNLCLVRSVDAATDTATPPDRTHSRVSSRQDTAIGVGRARRA